MAEDRAQSSSNWDIDEESGACGCVIRRSAGTSLRRRSRSRSSTVDIAALQVKMRRKVGKQLRAIILFFIRSSGRCLHEEVDHDDAASGFRYDAHSYALNFEDESNSLLLRHQLLSSSA